MPPTCLGRHLDPTPEEGGGEGTGELSNLVCYVPSSDMMIISHSETTTWQISFRVNFGKWQCFRKPALWTLLGV